MKVVPRGLGRVFRRPSGRAARIAYDLGQLAIGLIVGLFLFDRVVMPRVVRQGWDAMVPDLHGVSREEGETLLAAARLHAGQVLEVSDSETPAGRIISQDPPAGSRVRRGRLVHLLVSQGSPVREIPDLVGKTVRSARLDLAQEGLEPGAVLDAALRVDPRRRGDRDASTAGRRAPPRRIGRSPRFRGPAEGALSDARLSGTRDRGSGTSAARGGDRGRDLRGVGRAPRRRARARPR